jgi:5-hydroxyisourate hydrolase
MGLSTHVLDTAHGCPAAGMGVALYRLAPATQGQGETQQLLKAFNLNADGRNPDGLLLAGEALCQGTYLLVFQVAAYFAAKGVALPNPPFLNQVRLDFGVADPSSHYHVPLLCSPWSYSTYRGS